MKIRFLISGIFAATVAAFSLLVIVLPQLLVAPQFAGAQTMANMISNPSFEVAGTAGVPQGWIKGRWGSNTAVFTYPVVGQDGGKSAKVELTSRTTGDAKWAHAYVSAEAGSQYEYTDSYLSDVQTRVVVEMRRSDGVLSYVDIGMPQPVQASSTEFTARFIVPQGITSMRVFHVIAAVGYLTLDSVSLVNLGVPVDPTKFDKGYVTINFDDGWRSSYDIALPKLDALGFTSTHCIATDYLTDNYPGYIKSQEMLDIQTRGHEICAHTESHADLAALPAAEAKAEIEDSRQRLLDLGASPVATFGYPFGAYNASIKQMVRDAGMIGARSSDGGQNLKTTDQYALKRQPMVRATTFLQAKSMIDEALAQKTWLVLLFHRVDNSGTAYAMSPALFDEILAYIASKNIEPITLSEGLAKMN